MSKHCHYCPKTFDLRPYGPGGAMVCFKCAMATPDRKKETGRMFMQQIEAAQKADENGIACIKPDEAGPYPRNIKKSGAS